MKWINRVRTCAIITALGFAALQLYLDRVDLAQLNMLWAIFLKLTWPPRGRP